MEIQPVFCAKTENENRKQKTGQKVSPRAPDAGQRDKAGAGAGWVAHVEKTSRRSRQSAPRRTTGALPPLPSPLGSALQLLPCADAKRTAASSKASFAAATDGGDCNPVEATLNIGGVCEFSQLQLTKLEPRRLRGAQHSPRLTQTSRAGIGTERVREQMGTNF